MAKKTTLHNKMRIWHRYLGFFLAGIMAIYALSGVVLIFRDTDFLKRERIIEKELDAHLDETALGKVTHIKELKITGQEGDIITFKEGSYNASTGKAIYKMKSLPPFMEKLTKLHKANSKSPLFLLNIFFGAGLLFFVVSSFWMFLPKTSIFKKSLYFTLGGVALAILMLYL